MERVSVDLFHFGSNTYLIMVDTFSNYPMIKNFVKTSSTTKLINQMTKWFITFGYAKYCCHEADQSSGCVSNHG